MDNTEPLATIAIGDPKLIPATMSEVLDATVAVGSYPTDGVTQATIVDLIVDELTPAMTEVVQRIATVAALRDFATERVTFSEWLGSSRVRDHVPGARPLIDAMDNDPGWPREARTFAEIRDNVDQYNDPGLYEIMTLMWECYRAAVIDPHGSASTIKVTEEYATRVVWPDGHDEIHPRTGNGTSRIDARDHADDYNQRVHFCAHRRGRPDDEPVEVADVVRRSTIVGPWYAL